MSNLLSLLSFGSAGIAAQNTGVSVATNNVSNANTEGYSRQRVDLESMQAAPLIGGVRSGTPDRFQDALLGGRITTAAGALAMSQAFSSALSELEGQMVGGGSTIDEQIGSLFSRFSQVAASPTDPTSRSAVVAAARDLVSGIKRRSAAVATARKEADARIRDGASRATALAKQLAATNKAIATSNDPVLRDHRDLLAKQLAAQVGGSSRVDADGQLRFVLDGGAVLVDGSRAATVAATPNPVTGLAKLEVVDGAVRRDVTADLGGGAIAGDLRLRDQTLARASSQLDQLAYDVTGGMNAIHSANAGLDGVSGRPMFAALSQVAGAADAIAIDPALDADPSLLATAAPGTGPGNNQGALSMFAAATQLLASSGTKTFADAALDTVAQIALDTSDAKGETMRDSLVADHLTGLRDSLAGVDTQEELTNLARFSHASAAMTKFVTTIDDMLGSLIQQL